MYLFWQKINIKLKIINFELAKFTVLNALNFKDNCISNIIVSLTKTN